MVGLYRVLQMIFREHGYVLQEEENEYTMFTYTLYDYYNHVVVVFSTLVEAKSFLKNEGWLFV